MRVGTLCAFIVLICCFVYCSADNSPGCCSPKQWQGYSTGFFRVKENAFSEYVYYDFINKRFRADLIDISTQNDNVILETVIERYDLGYVYVLKYQESQTTCTYYPLNGEQMVEACIPPGGKEHPFTYGVNLKCISYTFYDGGNIASTFTASADSCIPISGVILASQQQRYVGELEVAYFNVDLGISDPFIFSPPSGCTLTNPPSSL